MTREKSVADTVEFYRRPEVVNTFEKDRYSTPAGQLRYELQNEMFLDLTSATADPILEIAGGTGRFTRQFVAQGRKVFVMDASMAMIESNRGQEALKGSGTQFVQGVAQHIPFPDNTFGTVFCVDMFSHIKDADPIIREMARVLKPGGHLVINFTNRSSLMGLGATYISNPLRKLFGKLSVYANYHWSGDFLKTARAEGLTPVVTSGLFFIDPRLYRFWFGPKVFSLFKRMEQWFSRTNCRFFYEQVWLKAVK